MERNKCDQEKGGREGEGQGEGQKGGRREKNDRFAPGPMSLLGFLVELTWSLVRELTGAKKPVEGVG